MPNYRRANVIGGTYFITQVTYQREPWLCREVGRKSLREAIHKVRAKYPFSIDAGVYLRLFGQYREYFALLRRRSTVIG